MNKFLSNPALHFIILGVVFYFLYITIIPAKKESIYVSDQIITELVQAEQNISLVQVDEKHKQELIENYIDEEVLLKEAYKRGLHKSDYRVRKQLLNLMRSSLTDIIPDPTNAQLRAFYDENITKYQSDTSFTVQTVFFNFNSQKIPEDPKAFKLQLTAAENPILLSEFSPYGNLIRKGEYRRISLEHGRAFADAVYSSPKNKWIGPIQAKSGVEYLKVLQKHDPEVSKFEKIESYLKTDYYLTKSREKQLKKIQELRAKYNIVIGE